MTNLSTIESRKKSKRPLNSESEELENDSSRKSRKKNKREKTIEKTVDSDIDDKDEDLSENIIIMNANAEFPDFCVEQEISIETENQFKEDLLGSSNSEDGEICLCYLAIIKKNYCFICHFFY